MWVINFIAFIITCFLWIKIANLDYNINLIMGLIIFFVASPVTYYTMQAETTVIISAYSI